MKRKMTLDQFARAVFNWTGDPALKSELITEAGQLAQLIQECDALSISDALGDVEVVLHRYKLLSDVRDPKSEFWDMIDNYTGPVVLPDAVIAGKDALHVAMVTDCESASTINTWVDLLQQFELTTYQNDDRVVLLSPLKAFLQ